MTLVNIYFAIFRRRFYKVQALKAVLLYLSYMIALIYIPVQYNFTDFLPPFYTSSVYVTLSHTS